MLLDQHRNNHSEDHIALFWFPQWLNIIPWVLKYNAPSYFSINERVLGKSLCQQNLICMLFNTTTTTIPPNIFKGTFQEFIIQIEQI